MTARTVTGQHRGAVDRGRLPLQPDDCYRAVRSRDARFDGWFFVGVTSTGIYCRPSCPTPVHPRRDHARFYPSAAAAQRAGFRACKRCRPDATPGSPDWDVRADIVGRAMRLIADGVVDREGVTGLASRLAVSTRHLDRLLAAEVGAGPLAIARAQRAQTARTLIETTALSMGDVAFAAGFSSIRQFNDTVREVFDRTPTALRSLADPARGAVAPHADAGVALTVRLPRREPFDATALWAWFASRPIPGVQEVEEGTLVRTLPLPGGGGVARLTPREGWIDCALVLSDVADLASAVERCRRLLDLDADPIAIADDLGAADPGLAAALVRCRGLRAPGSVDGLETAVVAIVGQQISVAAAHRIVGRVVGEHGTAVAGAGERRAFPTAEVLAAVDLAPCGVTRRGAAAIATVAELVAGGVALDPGTDRDDARSRLMSVRGVGAWTADYVSMRALRNPDVWLGGDLVARRGAARLGLDAEHHARWSPWRTYVTQLCWAVAASQSTGSVSTARSSTT